MIRSWDEYSELSQCVDTAKERLIGGQGPSGSHYLLIHILRKDHGIVAMSREEAIKKATQLLDDFVMVQAS